MNNIEKYTDKIFESIKHIDDYGNEYWYARELMVALKYKQWRYFEASMVKAMEACNNSNYNALDHFAVVRKMVSIGSNTKRNIKDYKLSRYACYLIVQNCDPRKKIIALAQTYFAIQTRKQELSEMLSEDEKRLMLREKTKRGNYKLNRTALNSGVKDLSKFHNAGYKGLYNGETADDIAKRKDLRYREDILDNMGSVELVDNLFRIIHTDSKLKMDNIKEEQEACNIHYEVGKKVRKAIADIGGVMPENLETPSKSLKELENKK